MISIDKKFDEFGGARSEEFPVGRKVGIVNRNIVGMAFNAHVFVARSQDGREAIDGVDRGSAHGRSTAVVKTNFPKTDDEAFLSGLNVDDATANFRSEGFLQFLLLTTPNLASGHAVEETLRGGSSYTHGKFEVGDTGNGRHSREYTAAEVERLAGYAGFEVASLRTQDFYWPAKTETLQQLVVQGFSVAQRGDTIFMVAKKRGPVRERYPEEFYVATGVRMVRGEAEGASSKLSQEPAVVART